MGDNRDKIYLDRCATIEEVKYQYIYDIEKNSNQLRKIPELICFVFLGL